MRLLWLEVVLFLASALFLARSSYEMFILTPRYGPQMIFFSLLHTWPGVAVILFIASWFAYLAFVATALLVGIVRLVVAVRFAGGREALRTSCPVGSRSATLARILFWLAGPPGRAASVAFYGFAMLAAAHFLTAMTYDRWSLLFKANG